MGAEGWYRAQERQVEILKEMGVNAIRVSHNPASDELVEICNRLGMLLIDESFDTWEVYKNGNTNDFAKWFNVPVGGENQIIGATADMTWAEFEVTTMVNRGKNSPAVIAWSLGNEIFEGVAWVPTNYGDVATKMIAWVKGIDDTRPITFGQNDAYGESGSHGFAVADAVHASGGIVGRNYGNLNEMQTYYDKGWTIYASETSSSVNSRGVYSYKGNAQQTGDKLLTSYDKSYVGWGASSSESWYNTIRFDAVAGEFLWTGIDYLGEPTPWNGIGQGSVGSWPAPKSAYFGIIDTAGLPKDSFYLYQSQWNELVNTLHVLPTWNEEEVVVADGNVEAMLST